LLKALHDPDPVIRMDTVRKAGKSGDGDLLMEALHDDDPDIRYVAARSLGGGSEKKVRALLELCKDDHAYVRKEALHALKFLPPGARTFLYRGVENDDPQIRAATAYALVYVPPHHVMGMEFPPPPRPPEEEKTIARLMIPLMKDKDLEVRKAAYFCLFSYWLENEEAQQVISALEGAPPETDEDARDLSERLSRWMKQKKPPRNRYRDEE
jgi:HEAT repeat protein